VPGLLARRRGRALIFSKETPGLLWGIARCLWQLGGLPGTLVWDRQAGLCTPAGQPTAEFAALCGRLRVGWHFCGRRDPQAKGAVERLQGYLETNFEPGRHFANERDYQVQLDQWFVKANARTHRALRCRPVDRLIAEREAMKVLPAFPDLDRHWVTRVPADPHLRFDTCDYSLDPRLAGRRVEVRVSQTEVTAVALDTGELACRHKRSFARYRLITALEHARALRELRGHQADEPATVQTRPLERYDALIA
jgi:Mu transposase, C-terminal domain